ncbi:MAG: hypothetical protein U0354_11525 [Candidatus Sericytochromatia bacterium]
MSKISILPEGGTRLNVGYTFGTNKEAVKDVQSQLDSKGYDAKAGKLGSGGSLTLSKDIISVNLNKNNDFSFKSGAEISGGLMRFNTNVKVGEKDIWTVNVREDHYNDQNQYTHFTTYERQFETQSQAFLFANSINQGIYSTNNTNSYASVPIADKEDIYNSSSKAIGSIKVGVTAGVQKDFNFGSFRVDALTGYDILQKGAYTGGRLSYANNVNGYGLFTQFDKNITGNYKEPKFQIGITYNF